jgi:hypothetical protein
MTFSKYIYHFDNGKEKSSGTIDRPAFGPRSSDVSREAWPFFVTASPMSPLL